MAVFPRFTVTQLAVGAVASVVAVKVARPLLVEIVRAGYTLKDLAQDTVSTAKTEIKKVAEDAKHARPEAGPSAEVAVLRAQVQALQAQLAAKKA